MSDFGRLFEDLGRAIDRAWAAHDYHPDELPSAASLELREHRLHERASWLDVVRWVHRTSSLAPQVAIGSSFGEPPVTVFRTSRFFIEVLFWREGIPAIHQHAFTGAFQVFEGRSLHTCFRFTEHERLGSSIRLGELASCGWELLERGDVRGIPMGESLIHSTFHLAAPTVSIVARTFKLHDAPPQFQYTPPGLAFAHQDADELVTRRTQLLELLWTLDRRAEYEAELSSLLASADADASLRYLLLDGALGDTGGAAANALALFNRRYPRLSRAVSAAGAFQQRRIALERLRGRISDDGGRYFLAVALNAPTPAAAFDLVAAGGAADPGGFVLQHAARALAIEGLCPSLEPALLEPLLAAYLAREPRDHALELVGGHASAAADAWAAFERTPWLATFVGASRATFYTSGSRSAPSLR